MKPHQFAFVRQEAQVPGMMDGMTDGGRCWQIFLPLSLAGTFFSVTGSGSSGVTITVTGEKTIRLMMGRKWNETGEL